MKLLLFSDVHRDWVTGGLERGEEIDRALTKVRIFQASQPVDRVIFLGDWCDPDSAGTHRAAASAVELYRSLQTPSVWLTGNHDVIHDGYGSHTLMALKKAGGIVVDEPSAIPLDSKTLLVCLPYTSLSHVYDPVAYVRSLESHAFVRTGSRVVVVGHMTSIPGVPHGSETDEMGRGHDMVFPVAACREVFGANVVMANGHFHQRIVDGPVLVPGSLARLTHGEERNDPGFLVVTV